MKSDKFKELYSKIDTDASMDHRIKNRLLYYDYDTIKENELKSRFGDRYDSVKKKSFFQRVPAMKPVLPSLAILLFVAAVLIGIRANLFHKAEIPAEGIEASTGKPTGIGSLNNMPSEDSEAENILEANQNIIDKILNDIDGKQITELQKMIEPEAETPQTATDTEVSTDSISITIKEAVPNLSDIPKTDVNDKKTERAASPSDFYDAYFNVITENNVKTSIPSLIIRLHGTVETINPDDLTEVVLTRDGIVIENSVAYSGRMEQFTWNYEDITDFYFEFATVNRVPGKYGLTGNFMGNNFTVYNKYIEEAVTDEVADPEDLESVSWCYLPDEKNQPKIISEVVFYFKGLQNAFHPSDLTELKLTVNGSEIPFSFEERAFRYYEERYDKSGGDTSFNLILKEDLTTSGTYRITGNYLGKAFTSMELMIP